MHGAVAVNYSGLSLGTVSSHEPTELILVKPIEYAQKSYSIWYHISHLPKRMKFWYYKTYSYEEIEYELFLNIWPTAHKEGGPAMEHVLPICFDSFCSQCLGHLIAIGTLVIFLEVWWSRIFEK